MKNSIAFCLSVLVVISSKAQFSGAYAPSKWNTFLSAGSNGAVNASGAPTSIIITGSDGAGGSDVDIDYTVRAIASGVWTFHWAYHTNDIDASPVYDPAGVLINGIFTQLTNDGGPIDQSGNFSIAVNINDMIGFRIRATDNTAGDATFTISSFGPPAGVLPVVMGSLTAKPQNDQVLLNWLAPSKEQATASFLIQRSLNGTNFNTIGQVQAATGVSNYSFRDSSPLKGMNYYRVKLVAQNNEEVYSGIALASYGSQSQYSVYPNPATSNIVVTVVAKSSGTETITLTSVQGTIMKKEILSVEKGLNQTSINISSLPAGIYFVKSGSGWSGSFVKK